MIFFKAGNPDKSGLVLYQPGTQQTAVDDSANDTHAQFSEISRKMERPIIGYIVISVDLQFLPFMQTTWF